MEVSVDGRASPTGARHAGEPRGGDADINEDWPLRGGARGKRDCAGVWSLNTVIVSDYSRSWMSSWMVWRIRAREISARSGENVTVRWRRM